MISNPNYYIFSYSSIFTLEDDKSTGVLRSVESSLAQAKDLIKQMEIEARSQDGQYACIYKHLTLLLNTCYAGATRKVLSEKIAACKRTETSLVADYGRAKEQVQKSGLIGGKSENQRQRLLNTNEK
jgi:Vesicle transport v-SNARE protein N-terminus